jgi:hypothetical protein
VISHAAQQPQNRNHKKNRPQQAVEPNAHAAEQKENDDNEKKETHVFVFAKPPQNQIRNGMDQTTSSRVS